MDGTEVGADRRESREEGVLDTFWERPWRSFAAFVHARYIPLMIDVFAGRIYEGQPSDAVQAFRRLLARERTYGQEDDYSVPIGSRHHSERARIWNADDAAVELTEAWMRGE